jgi:hypothetical protein
MHVSHRLGINIANRNLIRLPHLAIKALFHGVAVQLAVEVDHEAEVSRGNARVKRARDERQVVRLQRLHEHLPHTASTSQSRLQCHISLEYHSTLHRNTSLIFLEMLRDHMLHWNECIGYVPFRFLVQGMNQIVPSVYSQVRNKSSS